MNLVNFSYNSITVEGTAVTDIRNNGVKIVHKARIRFMAGNIEFFADLEPEDRENYESVSEKVLIPVERGRIRYRVLSKVIRRRMYI